jgi:choline-phosphate cytidylyltransferase
MNSFQRKECVKHCKWVDEIVDAPWFPDVEFLNKINAHYIAHDPEPYPAPGIDDVYGDFKIKNRFLPTTRTDGISTTDIINNVIFNYDEYVHRAIRKKTALTDLNLSAVDFLKYKFRELGHSIKDEVLKLAKNVEEQEEKEESKALIKEFLVLYK